jgi:lipopolysaccharide transport system ATP-binding protein
VPEQIRALCDDVLVLDVGRMAMVGSPDDALRCYDELMAERTRRRARELGRPVVEPVPSPSTGVRHGTQEGAIEHVRLVIGAGRSAETLVPGDDLDVWLEVRLPSRHADFAISVGVFSGAHVKCFEVLVRSAPAVFGLLEERARLCCTLPGLHLLPGEYSVVVGLYPPGIDHAWDYHWHMHRIRVSGDVANGDVSGVLNVVPRWRADVVSADGPA